MSIFAAIAGPLIGGIGSMYAAKKGAKAQQKATNEAIAVQRGQYEQARNDQMPWLDAGTNALARQQQVLDGTYTGFMQSPDYQAALESGTRQLDAGATARGNLWGGGADADRIRFGQNLAAQNLNNYWAKLAGMSGAGQQSAQSLGVMGQNMANSVGNALIGQGQARASAYAAQGNAFADMVNGGIGAYGYKKGWW